MAALGASEFRANGTDYTINDPNNANEFSASVAYSAGQYVYYQGILYRFTADHAAGAWNSAHVTQAKLGQDVSDLKSALNAVTGLPYAIEDEFDFPEIQITKAAYYWIDNNGIATKYSSANFASAEITANKGETYLLKSYIYGASAQLNQYFACDDNYHILLKSPLYSENIDIQGTVFVVPEGCTKLIVQGSALNGKTIHAYKAESIVNKIAGDFYSSYPINIIKESKYYYNNNGVAAYGTSPNFVSSVLDCESGDVYYLSGTYKAVAAQNPYYICDNSMNILAAGAAITEDTSISDLIIKVNYANAKKLVVQGSALNNNTISVKKQESTVIGVYNELDVVRNESMVYGELDINKQSGFYYTSSGVATKGTSPNFVYAIIGVVFGQKNKISAYETAASALNPYYYCDDDMNIIEAGTPLESDGQITDQEITAPFGATKLIVQGSALSGRTITIKGYHVDLPNEKPLTEFSYIAFGDSITATASRWRTEFLNVTGVNEIACYAVGGAHLCDYEDTVLDGNPTGSDHANTVCNQVQQMLNNPPSEVPDFVVISAGTNDFIEKAALDSRTLPNIQQNLSEYRSSTPAFVSLANVDRTAMDGAMRWQAEKIWSQYPKTKIIFIAPIQSADNATRPVWSILAKGERMEFIANYMSCYTIQAGKESGIWAYYEIDGANGKYLADGLHPNTDGGIVLGKYIASKIIQMFKDTKTEE